MDAGRFESLLRSLSHAPSRRTTLRLLVGSALGGLLTTGSLSTAAKKRGGKGKGKGKKKRGPGSPPLTCGTGTKVCNGQCVATTVCCGGCPTGSLCQNGACNPCGASGQPCCPGNTCGGGLECAFDSNGNTCGTCGLGGQPCCVNAPLCKEDLSTCLDGTCV
jgi:hypothetical protein